MKPTLSAGMTGPEVLELQRNLERLHFRLFVPRLTTHFGHRTESAVKRLQAAYGLEVDGVVGSATWPCVLGDGHLTPHFTVFEFASKGNRDLLLDRRVPVLLERLRERFERPVRVLSGYRDPAYNKTVGGAPHSYHMKGMAADIAISNISLWEITTVAATVGFRGIITYRKQGFVHLDVRDVPYRESK